MAESYKCSKSKTSRSTRREDRSTHRKDESGDYEMEPKTPPLPSKYTGIEELMKKRESIKKELKNLSKHTNTDQKSSKYIVKQKSTKDHNKSELKRKHPSDHEKPKQMPKSPEYNGDLQLDSEDEENIIEERRKQRKQLLEKFNTSNVEEISFSNETDNENQLENKTAKTVISDIKPKVVKDVTDMFAEKDEFTSKTVADQLKQDICNDIQLTENWDDPEGYYNARVGDLLHNKRYTVKKILGQGVYANVVQAVDNHDKLEVAIKMIRNNDFMYTAGLKEIGMLTIVNNADPDDRHHCVKFIRHFTYKKHLCLVLEPMYMDLRAVLKKYGKHHGINIKALMSYSRQLLMALRLLKKVGVIHADIKPDNILVNEKKNILKLCDFGSARQLDDNEPTPYLVSRFYRAPEIILGMPYKHGVDMWATACTIYEMATGKIMFPGSSNNKMLKCFMDLKGKIPSKLIKKGKFKDQHFNYNNNFLLHKKDEFTGREKSVEIYNVTPVRDLYNDLKKHSKHLAQGEEKKLKQLKDFLDKMLMIDPHLRPTVVDCLKHPFVQEELQK